MSAHTFILDRFTLTVEDDASLTVRYSKLTEDTSFDEWETLSPLWALDLAGSIIDRYVNDHTVDEDDEEDLF